MPHRPHRAAHALLRVAAAVVAAALLAACSSGGGGKDRPTVITYWSWVAGSQELADGFNATHDDVKVDFQLIPNGMTGGYSKMYNAVKAGKAPDVATVEYPELPAFATQNVVQPLSGVAGLKDQYPSWTWNQVNLGGEVYGLPKDIAPLVLFYRKDLFAKYGLTPPTTWARFRALAESVAKDHPGVKLATLPSSDSGLVSALAWQSGAHWFDTGSGKWRVNASDGGTRRMAEYWTSMARDKLVAVQPYWTPQHVTDLQKGRNLTVIAAPWSAANMSRVAPGLKGKWGVAEMPHWPGGSANGNYGGSSMALLRGAKHPDAAMEFIRWVSASPRAPASAAALSTAYPANKRLVPAARRSTEQANGYVKGMGLYQVAARAAAAVDGTWEWGPDMTAGLQDLADAGSTGLTARGGLASALVDWEKTTIGHLRQRGFDIPD